MTRARDQQRLDSVQRGLEAAGLDAIACRLPENVLLFSGYWPMSGMSWAIVARGQEPYVIAPVGEEEFVETGWPGVARFYGWGGVNDAPPDESLSQMLGEASRRLGLHGRRIGFEGSVETIAPPYMAAENHLPASQSWALLRRAVGDNLVDATPQINEWRSVKTPYEVEAMRLANEVAGLGLQAFVDAAVPGAKEAEVSAAVEAAIYGKGTGYKGVRRSKAWGEVMSGPAEGAVSWYQFLLSTDRRLEEGDTALLELGTCVEGYWSDLTRTVLVGKASEQMRDAYDAVLEAQTAGINALKPGVEGQDIHAATTAALEKRGWLWAFPHGTGHGLGFRYHEPLPLFLPGYTGKVRAGNVVTVEPGVYDRSFGGIRIEDDILVTENGPEYLSTFPRELVVTGG